MIGINHVYALTTECVRLFHATNLERPAVVSVCSVVGEDVVQGPFIFTQTATLCVATGVFVPQVIQGMELLDVQVLGAVNVRLLCEL